MNGAFNDDPTGNILELGLDDWNAVFAVHVIGASLVSRAVLPLTIPSGGGSIVPIGPQMSHVGAKGRPSYLRREGAPSCIGWRGRALIREKPSVLRILPIPHYASDQPRPGNPP